MAFRRIDEEQGQDRDDRREGDAEEEHGLVHAPVIDEIGRQGARCKRGQAEPAHHDARDEPRAGGREPLERGRRGGGIAEADAQPARTPKPMTQVQ